MKHDPSEFDFEPFKSDTKAVVEFDCGNKDLNDFLCTDEVRKYQDELLGRTVLVYHQGSLIAYYTVYNHTIRLDYLKTYKSFTKLGEYHSDGIPSLAIGRLAVDKHWQRKGVGSAIVLKIARNALYGKACAGARLLIVQAKEDAVAFYKHLGFEFVSDTRNERKRYKEKGTRTMFLDLAILKKDIEV
jgi:GNAT superfamily N-acetyltransferase